MLRPVFRRYLLSPPSPAAVAHTILVIAWHVLKAEATYQELGPDYFEQRQAEALKRSLVRRLERLGNRVILQPSTETV